MSRLTLWLRSVGATVTTSQQFMLGSLLIIFFGMALIGWWVGNEIESGVIHRTSETVAIYVESLVSPELQGLDPNATALTEQQTAYLDWLIKDTGLGREVTTFKIWSVDGRVLYSNERTLVGQQFPIGPEMVLSLQGQVVADVSTLDDAENVAERAIADRLLEVYAPVRQVGSDRVLAVAEFYQRIDSMDRDVQRSRQVSWAGVMLVGALMYILLVGFVAQLNQMIAGQRTTLIEQVKALRELLNRNQDLDQRVRRAAYRTAELQERFRRRLSSELHDGPAQYLGLALLRLNRLADFFGQLPDPGRAQGELEHIRSALTQTMQEVRGISGGLGIPDLAGLTLTQTVERVARSHERRTGTHVALTLGALPPEAPLTLKITVYRVIQEALSNAFRHAGGAGQQIEMDADDSAVHLTVADRGPGFDPSAVDTSGEHMGLAGMRERVESLGGTYTVRSAPRQGCQIHITLPLDPPEDLDG